MKKLERLEKVRVHANDGGRSSPINVKGRFLFHTRDYWIVAYSGKFERAILCKYLTINNPDLISENWIEANKDKFNEVNGDLIIKREFKNFPFWGVTPYRLLKALGLTGGVTTRDDMTFLTFNGGMEPPEALKGLQYTAR